MSWLERFDACAEAAGKNAPDPNAKSVKTILEELSAFAKEPSKVKTKENLAELDSYLTHQQLDVREKAFLILAALGGTPPAHRRSHRSLSQRQKSGSYGETWNRQKG